MCSDRKVSRPRFPNSDPSPPVGGSYKYGTLPTSTSDFPWSINIDRMMKLVATVWLAVMGFILLCIGGMVGAMAWFTIKMVLAA